VDREQLRRALGDALSAIQRDGDVTGLDGLAASLTTLEGAYAFHGQATAKGPGRDASELQRADLEPSAGACEAGEENLMSSDRANLKDQIRVALLLIDQHSERPDVARIVEGLKGYDNSSRRFHAGEIQKNAQADLATLRVELATAWDRLEHDPLP
jgi:hypothetical protein